MDDSQFPPTQKGRHHEIRASGLRQFAGLRRDDQRLDPFSLARFAKLLVIPFDAIQALSAETRAELLEHGKDRWSGGAASVRLPDGRKLIILNPTHGKNRHNATLMEEIAHVFLGHKPSRLNIKNKSVGGKAVARDYDAAIEEEAYSTGAAALVPYRGLKDLIARGMTSVQIARHYGVSKALVEYRMKVSRLWNIYKERTGDGK